MRNYQDFDYALNRLKGTIIMSKGSPCEILGGEGNKLIFKDLLTGKVKGLIYSSNNFDINPVKLGYVNFVDANSQYICREPLRRDWRQGLRYNNMTHSNNVGVKVFEIHKPSLAKTIIGRFPSKEECVNKVQQQELASAFSRDFCVGTGLRLMYKGLYVIGSLNDNLEVEIKKGFNWVEEALMEDLQNAA